MFFFSWFSSEENEDNLEEFFKTGNESDEDELSQENSSYVRENTSLSLAYSVNSFSITLGKEK